MQGFAASYETIPAAHSICQLPISAAYIALWTSVSYTYADTISKSDMLLTVSVKLQEITEMLRGSSI